MSGRNLVLIRIPKVWRIINRYGGSRSLFPLYKHYKKLIEILLQCHQYFLPFFQVIILDIMMSCDFKNFHILTFVNFVLPAAWSWFEYFIFITCLSLACCQCVQAVKNVMQLLIVVLLVTGRPRRGIRRRDRLQSQWQNYCILCTSKWDCRQTW